MDIAVLGTGSAGRTIAARLNELGHHVVVGTRDPADTAGREEYAEWAATEPGDRRSPPTRTPPPAPSWSSSSPAACAALDVLDQAGQRATSRARCWSTSATRWTSRRASRRPLFVKDTDSLAEQLQRAHPQALVVKALNTMNASVMVAPGQPSEPSSVFVVGRRRGGQGHRHRAARELRPHRRDRPRRPDHRTGRRDVPAALAAADGLARDGELQHQGRALRPRWDRSREVNKR